MSKNKPEVAYKLVPPEGGWGHFITASVTVNNLVTLVPMATFGLVYGNFLASIGDETTGTTLVNGVFQTVQSFTGLASSFLLQKYSFRKVGLLGSVLYFAGAFSTIFITNLVQMIISFGVIQGLGFGLMMPATFSAFNCYFDKKLNLMMGIAQAIMVGTTMILPPVVTYIKDYYGFRGTVALLAAMSLQNFPAMLVLHPVKWYMKRVAVEDEPQVLSVKVSDGKSETQEVMREQIEPLIGQTIQEKHTNAQLGDEDFKTKQHVIKPKPRVSVISLGDRVMSVTTLNDGKQKKISANLDLSLFKSPKYLNIAFGVALSFTADVAFNSIIPLLLSNVGIETHDIAFLMMVYFGSDVLSRILFSLVSAFYHFKNRYVFLIGSFLMAMFRIAFVMNDSFMWKAITMAPLGFLRCSIQTPLALVISEEYNEHFPTAFSLYMVVCGVVSLIFGPLMSFVKSATHSDVMVVHVLTVALLICSFSWTVELAWARATKKGKL